jgi:hypothetical protein
MNKTKAYSKVSRQLTAILKGMDKWDDMKVFRKSIAMARSPEYGAVYKRVLGTKRWKEYTKRFNERWPGITQNPDSKLPYPEAYIDAQVEWYEKHEKNDYVRDGRVKRLEQKRGRLREQGRLE